MLNHVINRITTETFNRTLTWQPGHTGSGKVFTTILDRRFDVMIGIVNTKDESVYYKFSIQERGIIGLRVIPFCKRLKLYRDGTSTYLPSEDVNQIQTKLSGLWSLLCKRDDLDKELQQTASDEALIGQILKHYK